MSIAISTDSTCDLGEELCKKYNVHVLPLTVLLGENSYKDGIDIQPQDIFDYVAKTNVLPKTSAPSVEDYANYFRELKKDNDTVLHFNISSKASASNSNAKKAAEGVEGVYVVDSCALSTGQGLMVLRACDMAAEGKTAQEILKEIELLIPKVNTSFIPDTLDYLHKGGRCSLASLMGAKVLKIHPLIEMEEGQLYAKKKYIGSMSRCVKNYVADLKAQYPEYDKSRCFITHSHAAPALVEEARQLVKENFTFDEILETYAGSIVTSHCGQGTLGVLFITK